MRALAARSHDILFRDGTGVTFARTNYDGVTELNPILNLRQGFSPYRAASEYQPTSWTGGGVAATPNDRLLFDCQGPDSAYVYPTTLYWACDNSLGMHWKDDSASWNISGLANTALELWFR